MYSSIMLFKMLFVVLVFSLVSVATFAAEIVEFSIAENTGGQPWNTAETPIVARLGDTIRFNNKDSVDHQLHTFGSPCPHGREFGPGESFDCQVSEVYRSSVSGPLYDHGYGPNAKVFIEVIE